MLDLVKKSCPRRSCSKCVLGLAGLGCAAAWDPLGHILSAPWLAFSQSWAGLGPPWPLLGRLLGPLWALVGIPCLVGDVSGTIFCLPRSTRTLILEGLGTCRPGFGQALGLCLDMPFAAPLAFLLPVVTLLVVGDCNAFLDTCLHPLHNILDTMHALWHIMLLVVQ